MSIVANGDTSRRPAWKSNALLLLLSTLLCLVVAEVYFRTTSPHVIRKDTPGPSGAYVATGDYGYFVDTISGRRHIPNTHVIRVEQNGTQIPVDINSSGFRDREIPAVRSGELRVLVMGDSITFGSYLPVEDTFSRKAEQALAGAHAKGRIRVINGGVEGIGLKDEIDILADQGLAIAPDVVVVAFYLNDANPPDRLAAVLADPGRLRRHSVLVQTIYRTYKAWQWRRGELDEARMYDWTYAPPPDDWRTNRASLLRYAALAEKDWGAAWTPSSWDVIDGQLGRLRKMADEHGFSVVLLAFPVVFQVYADYLENDPQMRLRGLAARYRFAFLDLLPELRSRRHRTDLFLDHCHLSPAGHAVVGRALAVFLEREVLWDHRR